MRDQGRDCLIFCDVNFQGKCFNPHLLEAEMYRATKCVGGRWRNGRVVGKVSSVTISWFTCQKSCQLNHNMCCPQAVITRIIYQNVSYHPSLTHTLCNPAYPRRHQIHPGLCLAQSNIHPILGSILLSSILNCMKYTSDS